MILYSSEGLSALLCLCKQDNVLTIADEVMTGFGRTGPLFACDQIKEKPDIVCLSKGLTGGFLPLGATFCTEEIFAAFLSEHYDKALLHGHSYTANPIGCQAALASLDLLLTNECFFKRAQIAAFHQKFVEEWKTHPKLKRCERLGTILTLEFNEDQDDLYRYFMNHKIVLRPLKNVIYVMPPYCITEEELNRIYKSIEGLL